MQVEIKFKFYMLTMLALLLYAITCNAFVLMNFWNWFVVNEFGIEAITYTQAVVFVTLLAFTTYQRVRSGDNFKNAYPAGLTVIRPWLWLVMFWIAKTLLY